MDFVLTTAGLQALINVSETGTNAVELTHIGIGSGKYTPTKAQTALQSQIKTLRIIEGGQAGDNAIHVAARDADAVTYEAFEVGIFTSTGTLFAVTSQTTPIIQKTAAATALLAFDLKIVGAEAKAITFGDVTYQFTAGTTIRPGIVELATADEVIAGTDTLRVVTPNGLSKRTATTARTGIIRLASDAEAKTGTDAVKAITPATMKAALLSTYKSTTEAVDAGTNDTSFITPKSIRTLEANVSRRGLIQVASDEDIRAGTATDKAVTQKQLADSLVGIVPIAAEDTAGAIRIASPTEAAEGVVSDAAVTPATAKTLVDERACTVAEAKVGTENKKFLTPAALAGLKASNEEAIAGVAMNVFITPAALKAAIDGAVKAAVAQALNA